MVKKNKQGQIVETEFDKFSTNLIDVIMDIRNEMKGQYYRFVQLESKINRLCEDFLDLQRKYEVIKEIKLTKDKE